MIIRTLMTLTAALLLASTVYGQPAKPAAEKKPKASATATQELPRPPAQLANARLELTISDQRGTAAPAVKTVSMIVADRGMGRIRTGADVSTPRGIRPVTLNVDANVELLRENRIRVIVTLEYRPEGREGTEAEPSAASNISESINVILTDGQPLVVSRSADPHTDRKVSVELKATILK